MNTLLGRLDGGLGRLADLLDGLRALPDRLAAAVTARIPMRFDGRSAAGWTGASLPACSPPP